MLRSSRPIILMVVGMAFLEFGSVVHGQVSPAPRSLGGYGAGTIGRYYSNGSGGVPIPYGGSFGGFIPYRGLEPSLNGLPSLPKIEEPPVGGASIMMGRLAPWETRRFDPLGLGGSMGLEGRLLPLPDQSRRMRRRPRFGSPFRQPGWPGRGAGAMGSSM